MPDKIIDVVAETGKVAGGGGIGGVLAWLFMRRGLLPEKSHALMCSKVQAEFKLHVSTELSKMETKIIKEIRSIGKKND